MRALLLATICALAAPVRAEAPAKAPRWTKVPDGKYRCTRYAPGRWTGTLAMFAPPGKPMIFTMAAASVDRSKVTYRAEGLPTGATVDAKSGRFEWKIPPTATGTSTITLVAETTAGGKATYAFDLSIASPDLVAAWRVGMGSMTPDCANFVASYEIKDLDGDGATDLVWVTGDSKDDSANSGSYVAHLRRRVGTKFDIVTRDVTPGTFELVTAPDGKPALAIAHSCCCQANLEIVRVTASGLDTLATAGGEECLGYEPIEQIVDAKGHLEAIVERRGDPAKVTRKLQWSNGRYVE